MFISFVVLTCRCHLIHWNLAKKCAKYTHMLPSTQANIVLFIVVARWTMLYTAELSSQHVFRKFFTLNRYELDIASVINFVTIS